MALNIGELVAYLKMDKADWDAGKAGAKRDLDDIADEADRAGKKVDKSTKDAAKKVETNFNGMQFGLMFAGLPVAAAAAAAGTAGSLALVSGGFIALTAVALKQNAQVAGSVSDLSQHIEDSLGGMAAPLAGEYDDALDDIGKSFDRLQPQIATAMRNSARDVGILVDGVTGLAEEAMPGLVTATNRDGDALRGLSTMLVFVGHGASDFFVNLSSGSTGAGRDLVILGQIGQDALGFLGQLLANLANNGTPALGQFHTSLALVESTLLTLTAAGSPAYSMLSGFLSTANGGLAIIKALASVLGLLPPQMSQIAGGVLATSQILSVFGMNAGAAFSGLKDKISAADGAGGKLKAGMSGLAAAGMAPATLATAGLTAGLLILGKEQEEAQRAAASHEATVRTLTSALRQSSGAIDDTVRASVAQDLAQKQTGESGRSMLEIAKSMGVSLPTLTSAITGNADALGVVNQQIDAYAGANPKAAQTADFLKVAVRAKAGAFKESQQALIGEAEATDTNAAATGNLTYEQKLGQQSTADLSKAFQGLGSTETDVATKTKMLQQVLDILNGRTPSHEQAIQSINDAIRQLGDEFGQSANKADGWGRALINADGTVNSTTANGSKLYQTMTQLEQGFASAGASIDDLVKSGVPLAQATQQVSGELATQRQRFIEVATQMGLTGQQANALADKYGLVPNEVVTAILQPGMLDAITRAGVVREKVVAIPNQWTVQVHGLTAQAEANLNALGYHVTHLPNGDVWVTAPNAPAVEQQLNYVARDRTGHITMIVRQDGSVRFPNGSVASASGNLLAPFAGGGIAAYAGGGLRPMSSSVATMVPPNTWRVVGDNMRYQELYAPLNGSARTADLITAAARHEGLPVGDVMPVPTQRQGATISIANFHPPANASPHDIAEELDWMSKAGG